MNAQVKNVYNAHGQDFKNILKDSIINIITSGNIPEKMLLIDKQIVIEYRAKEEEFQ
jgi:hypothetical protein